MDSKIYAVPCAVLIVCAIIVSTNARSFNREERECNLLLRRLKRDAAQTNFIEDDDAFIENLIKITLNKEKRKCMEKYHLLESPLEVKQLDGANDATELRQEVAKLKDLVNVIKDQRYILKTLENSAQNLPNTDVKSPKNNVELESLKAEIHKIERQLESSKNSKHTEDDHKLKSSDRIEDKLEKQEAEINNLKQLLQGVLVDMKASKTPVSTTMTGSSRPSKDQDMTQMMKELSLLEKKLLEIQHSSQKLEGNSEVVGMRPSLFPRVSSSSLNGSMPIRPQAAGRVMQSRSTGSTERSADEELDALLTLLAPEKSTSSVQSLLKSLDSDSDDELERRLLNLEKQMKSKKKHQLEEKLKNLEMLMTSGSGHSAQSKSDIIDVDSNAELKRLLVKLLKKKHQQSESKSLDDDEVLEQLKSLQKTIKSFSTDEEDDLFDDLAEKNGNLDITLEKLINANGGSGGGTHHRRRKLTQAQIKALRRRIMAMKNGSTTGGGDDYEDAGNYFVVNSGDLESNLNNHGSGHGYGENNGPHWHITSGGTGSGYYGINGAGNYGPEEFGQYSSGAQGSGNKNGFAYGPNKYTNNFENYEHFYGAPTNQFGTPISFDNYQGSPAYSSSYHGNAGAYENSKYFNGGNSHYGSSYSTRPQGPAYGSGLGPYQESNAANYKQFFPAQEETSPGGPYNAHPNPGTPGAAQSYQNQPTINANGPPSIADLKNQIYDLQAVINNFNQPEYVQRPEDMATVYNLNKQINELKGVVNTLQETPYGGAPSQGDVYQASRVETYEAPAQPAATSPQHLAHEVNVHTHPAPQLPPQLHSPVPYVSPSLEPQPPQGNYQSAPVVRNYEGSYRKRRGVDVHAAIHRNEDVLNALGAFLGELLSVHEDISMPSDSDPVNINIPHVFDDINAKIAGVREQLDHRMNQQRLRQHRPIAPLPPLLSPKLRSNDYNDAYYNYHDYNDADRYDKGKGLKIKFKKDEKKADLLDKIFDKILDKIITKLEKAFPKIIEVIFGKLEFTKDYQSDNSNYGNNAYRNNYGAENYNQGGEGLIETFRGMGLFGLMPMIIMKILSKFLYIVQYLQRYKTFKNFVIPALILAIVAGAVVFLVWWLQPNDDTDYKQISHETTDNTYYHVDHAATPYEYYKESSPIRSVPLQSSQSFTSYNVIPNGVNQRERVEMMPNGKRIQ